MNAKDEKKIEKILNRRTKEELIVIIIATLTFIEELAQTLKEQNVKLKLPAKYQKKVSK